SPNWDPPGCRDATPPVQPGPGRSHQVQPPGQVPSGKEKVCNRIWACGLRGDGGVFSGRTCRPFKNETRVSGKCEEVQLESCLLRIKKHLRNGGNFAVADERMASTTLTPAEEAQLGQTIEMFEVITESQPADYQSL